jgi:outer membrane receptor protein involved in Fe transport
MNKLRLLGSSALGSAALIGLNFALAAPAAAQVRSDETAAAQSTDPTAIPPQAPNADGSAPTSGDEITVTGSRIRKSRTSGIDPVTVITNEERTEAGFNSSSDLLQSTAVTNGTSQINNAYGGFVTNGGPGANTLSLRGLGTSRSLVLLNGRRLAPSGSRGAVGSVDLNVLPTAMVSRIEVLNAGASSIYGSDAVAGVVNVITRTNVKGLELSAQVNVPEVGSGVEYRLAGVFGLQAGNLKINGAAEYYTRNALTFGDRDFTQCQTDYRLSGAGGAPDSGDYIDPTTGQPKCYGIAAGTGASGVTINTLGTPSFNGTTVALAPGVPAGYGNLPASAGFGTAAQQVCNRFRPNPNVTTGALPGYECVGGGFLSTDIRSTFPSSLLNTALISPSTNYNGYLQGTYQLNALGNAEIYSEVLASRRKSEQLGNRQLVIDYNQGSPLIPANLRNATFLNYSASGTPTGIPGTPIAARVFANFGNYDNYQNVDFVKGSIGIRGQLPHDWHYDAFASKSWADSTYTSNLVLTNRLAQSLDVVASGGGFACRNPIGGCVAAPALTPNVIGGQLPADWLNYITAPVVGTTKFRETTYNVTIDGPLFRLPGGMAQLVLGAEQRSQSLDDSPSQESVNGNLYSFSSSTPTRGTDRVREVYGELSLPLIHKGFIYDLSLDGSARYTNYRSYGGQWTYKIGGSLQPVEWLKFRGSYGTSFRAPQLFEQYLGATSGFNAANTDICNNLSQATAPVRLKNCLADGVPLGFQATTSVAVLQRGGAASGLKSETSRNYNAGIVFQPTFSFGQLSLAADYFDIRVDNGVSQLSSATIQSQCYDDPAFRANSVCNLVTRSNSSPYALTVVTGYVNISTSVLRGIDYTARFTAPVGPGKVRLGAQVTQFLKRYTLGLPTDPVVDVNGYIANPKFTGTFDAAYIVGGFTLRYGAEWVQHTDSDAYIGGGPTYIFHTPDYWLHSLSVTYRTDRFEYGIGVRNLTNKNPPFISSGAYTRIGNAPLYSGYDFVGRTFFANVVAHF